VGGSVITYVAVWGPDAIQSDYPDKVVKVGRAFKRDRIKPYIYVGARLLFYREDTPLVLERVILGKFKRNPRFAPAFTCKEDAYALLPGGYGRSAGAGWTECFTYQSITEVISVVASSLSMMGLNE
jgi:hypothetical protein